jgi:hypothetical protein
MTDMATAPALDESGVPAPGVILGEDGSIRVGALLVIGPVSKDNVYRGYSIGQDGSVQIGGYCIAKNGLELFYNGGVWIGGRCILAPCAAPLKGSETGIKIRPDGSVRLGRLHFAPGQQVCLVSALKAARRRWSVLRAAWVAACVPNCS